MQSVAKNRKHKNLSTFSSRCAVMPKGHFGELLTFAMTFEYKFQFYFSEKYFFPGHFGIDVLYVIITSVLGEISFSDLKLVLYVRVIVLKGNDKKVRRSEKKKKKKKIQKV